MEVALRTLVFYFIILQFSFLPPTKDHSTMSEPWHDINDPGYFKKPVKEKAAASAKEADDSPAAEKASSIVTLSDAKFVPPDDGVDFNDKCPASGVGRV